MAPENAIYNKAAKCLEAFNHCIESMTPMPWPQDQLDRFNLWAAHGGIFGSYQKRTSMDWRLRERPELVDMMLQLLDLLHEYLHLHAICAVADPVTVKFDASRTTIIQDAGHQSQPPISRTSGSASSSECSFGLAPENTPVVTDRTDTTREKVEQTIAELFRISAAIRSAGMSYRHTKAANFVEWQDGVNLTQKFQEGVELLLRSKKPSPSDYMVKRLVETICLRQRELAYSRRRRMGKVEKQATEKSIESHGVSSLPPRSTAGYSRQGGSDSTTSRVTRTAKGASHGKTAQRNTVESTIYTATYVPTTVFPQTKRARTVTSQPQWRTIDDSLTNLPLPPEVGKSLEFECPYCFIPFERAKFQGSSWRNHVLDDLRPYICILPDCMTPHVLYKDSISWIAHMQTKHKVAKWKCVLSCQSEIQSFWTEAEFLAHAGSEHKEDFTTEEMLELANLGRYEITRELEAGILLECPACTISFQDQDYLSVYSHIAEDLAEYAMISLPESMSLHADADGSRGSSFKSASIDDGRIGQRRESEVAADRMFPWSLWDPDNLETRTDLSHYDADLESIPEPSDADVAVLAEIRFDIRNARDERLQQEPDPSQNFLRLYKDESDPDNDEDMAIVFKDQASHTDIVHENYTVGWICAIHTEYVAALAFLDETHGRPVHLPRHDENDYTLGKLGKHNIVITVLPDGKYGISPSAHGVRNMLYSFPNIRLALMVGIGGGAPSKTRDIRLGDIVVSAPGRGSGVLQYDFGRTIQNQSFQRTGAFNASHRLLRNAVNGLMAQHVVDGHKLEEEISNIFQKLPRLRKRYSRPDPSSDRLYQSKIVHPGDSDSRCVVSCGTDSSKLILRPKRTEDEDNPAIHYGVIASGNQLIKDAFVRDKLATEENILCFETGAAGLMHQFPCLVVRGICDYSDSHKNNEWQGYAAMAAAAYAKDLLSRITPHMVETEQEINKTLSYISNLFADVHQGQTLHPLHNGERQRDSQLGRFRGLSPEPGQGTFSRADGKIDVVDFNRYQ